MSQEPNEQTQGKTGEQVEYGGHYAAVGCCRTMKNLGQGDTFPACPQHGNTTWGWIPQVHQCNWLTPTEPNQSLHLTAAA